MDEIHVKALRSIQQKLRTGITVDNILPELATCLDLTEVERSQVETKSPHNIPQVDELFKILRTKTNWHFDGFCRVLERNGSQHWAQQLREAVGDCREIDGRCASWVN